MPGDDFLPSLGYDEDRELPYRDERRERGLDEESSARPRTDTTARMRSVQARGAAWIDYEATVSTRVGQTPLAPGTRDSTWTEDGRRHARFHAPAPMLKSITFFSADYAVAQRRWSPPDTMSGNGGPVDVRVYYHPEHDFNVERMMKGAKRSLTDLTLRFGPYPGFQLRVIERPRWQASPPVRSAPCFPVEPCSSDNRIRMEVSMRSTRIHTIGSLLQWRASGGGIR